MDPARAAELRDAWAARLTEPPAPEAHAGVARVLAERVPDPDVAAAIVEAGGRRRVAALAAGALYLVWTTPGAPEAVRCRRVPLAAATVELSERAGERHWWFEIDEEPLVFRALDAADIAFATALARAVGWPAVG